ncbi:hypothetical protein [Oceanicoccus sp. KOV_DT_Chl]|uniref:hypothetical protein n=1 Tax=Oceanicoccus sp. KOV_DT_Chl TaxID=1904639 RepID=UPI000C7CF6E6|nr:hypothetical protein [Oceanicoccus sp. KOV_DT_Chl]
MHHILFLFLITAISLTSGVATSAETTYMELYGVPEPLLPAGEPAPEGYPEGSIITADGYVYTPEQVVYPPEGDPYPRYVNFMSVGEIFIQGDPMGVEGQVTVNGSWRPTIFTLANDGSQAILSTLLGALASQTRLLLLGAKVCPHDQCTLDDCIFLLEHVASY